MQTRNRIFDDLAKVANSAAGTMAGLKDEIENMVRYRIESCMYDMNMVSREEFDAVKAIAAKARSEQVAFKKRIEELEAKLDGSSHTTRARKKTTTTKKSAKK